MNSDNPIKTLETRIAYENPWIKIREDKTIRNNGDEGIYAYMEVKDSVCVVAVNDEGKICFIDSYRHPFKQWFWELPGGGGEGDDLIDASKRELEEETGVKANRWVILGRSRVCNGLSTEYQLNILATDLSYSDYVQNEDETRARKFISLSELDEMISSGEIDDNQSITAIYMYKRWLDKSASV